MSGLKRSVAAGRHLPGAVHVGHRQHRHPAAPRRHRRLRAVAGRAPVQRARTSAARTTSTIAAADSGPAAAFVWKTVADPFAGRITLFRVVSGALKSDSTVHNVTRDTPERLGHLVLLQGKTQTNVPEIKAGDLGAVAKLKDTQTSDLLADKSISVRDSADQVPRAGDLLRDRAEDAAATRTRSARRCTGCRKRIRASATRAIRRPRSCCSPARASRTSR